MNSVGRRIVTPGSELLRFPVRQVVDRDAPVSAEVSEVLQVGAPAGRGEKRIVDRNSRAGLDSAYERQGLTHCAPGRVQRHTQQIHVTGQLRIKRVAGVEQGRRRALDEQPDIPYLLGVGMGPRMMLTDRRDAKAPHLERLAGHVGLARQSELVEKRGRLRIGTQDCSRVPRSEVPDPVRIAVIGVLVGDQDGIQIDDVTELRELARVHQQAGSAVFHKEARVTEMSESHLVTVLAGLTTGTPVKPETGETGETMGQAETAPRRLERP